MLHVTNGDAAATTMSAAGLDGPILPWRDVLHDGPVPEDLAPEALRAVRAAFIAGQGWGTFAEVLGELRRRDAALAQAETGVLWFEHDLYDQLQLLQVVDALARAGRTGGWALVQAETYLGEWSAEDFRARRGEARPLSDAQVALARRAWAAFRAPTPERLAALLREDTSALPHLAPALRRLLEELPSARDGLARSERQVLEVLARGGPLTFPALFRAWSERETPVWMGDASLRSRLVEMAAPSELLVASYGSVWALTPQGADVLEGRVDRVALGGLRRWWGGTLLDAARGTVWRREAVVRAGAGRGA